MKQDKKLKPWEIVVFVASIPIVMIVTLLVVDILLIPAGLVR